MMKNKLLIALTIVVGVLIVLVIVKNFIKKDLKKNDPMAYDLTYGKSSNSETRVVPIKPEVKPDSTNYWKAANFPGNLMFRIDTLGEGVLFAGKSGEPMKEFCPINWKKTGELVVLTYFYEGANITEWLSYYNINTLITVKGDMKLVRVQKR